jgi:Exocyst complex subunit Sec15-like
METTQPKTAIGASSQQQPFLFVSKTYPFSSALPSIVRDVYVMFCRVFLFTIHNDHLHVTGPMLCDVIGNVLHEMAAVMGENMSKDELETPISKACQISVDALAISQALVHSRYILAYALAHFQKQESVPSDLVMMITRARGDFESLAVTAHGFLFELLQHKLDALLSSLVFIDWVSDSAPVGPTDAVQEVVEYLSVTFQWLSSLPHAVRDSAHFMGCTYVSDGITTISRSLQEQRPVDH